VLSLVVVGTDDCDGGVEAGGDDVGDIVIVGE